MSIEPLQLELEGASIVARGSFNPAIFQPRWFSGNDLIRDEEAETAEIEIIHKDVTIFSTEWFSIQVTGDRFGAETRDPRKYRILRDLVFGTFKILEHTPITVFGFNRIQHFHMPSEEEWSELDHRYAPKSSWQGVMNSPRLRSLLVEGKREESDAERIQVRLEPSQKINPGACIQVNEHYDPTTHEDLSPGDYISFFLKTLPASWGGFLSYTDTVARHLLAPPGQHEQ